MKTNDVDILRSKVSLINGYKERIRGLFGVELSFTAEPSTGDNFLSDNEVENADPEIVRLRLISGSSQESLDQAKSYIASLTAEGSDLDSYAIELHQENYRMILQSRDVIEKTSQAVLNFNDTNDETQNLLIYGQKKSVSLARSVVENMVRERTDNKSYCDDVRTRGGVGDDVGSEGDVSSRLHEIDVMNKNYSCVQSYSNNKPDHLADFYNPLSDCEENLQTDSGPPAVTGDKDLLCEGFNSDADFDDVVIESGDDDNIEEKLVSLKSEDLCTLQSRSSDIDEEILKLTRMNISSPITDDELVSANDPLIDPDYNNKVQFALKLGYSEDQLKTVMVKLGSNTEQNELLSELIKLDKYVKPKQDVERTVSDESDKTNSGEFYGSFTASPYDKSSDEDFSVETSLTTASRLLSENFRPVVIDGSNVAMSHGDKETFSCRGIKLAVDWFRQRGHRDITVFVPQWRKETSRPNAKITDQHLLGELEEEKVLVFTPARRIGGRRVICYDDRYILKLAVDTGGIVVSNDNYRDLIEENAEFRKVVEERLLMYSFVNDRFMPPDDPLGRNGPKLDNFLCKEPTVPEPLPPLCPYGSKKCTYGNKCKYYHPERGNQPQKTITEELAEKLKQKTQEVKDRGTKISEGDKKKPLTKKPKAKVALQRTRSLVPPSMTESSSDDKSHNRHSADLSDLVGDDVQVQGNSEISTEKLEKTKTYNDKLDEYRKLVEKAEQEERKRQEEETRRQVKETDNASLDLSPLCSSLSTSRELLVSRSPSPHQRSCSPSQLKPQEQFLSGHLLLAKKLSDEAAEKKARLRADERDTTKTPPVEAPHQPSALQYRCNSPLAQPTPVSQSHHQHKPLTSTLSKQGQVSSSPSQSQPQRKHQSLSRQLSLQGNQDPRLHRTLQQQSSYDPRMLSRQHYHQNMPELDRQNIRHTELQRQPAAFYGEQEHFLPGPLQLPNKDNQQRSQQYFQPYSHYDNTYDSETDKHVGSMEHPALSRMQSAPEAPQLRKAIAPAKIGRMVRQNSNSDTQLHVMGGDQESPYLGISDLQNRDFQQGDKLCYGDNQGASFQLQPPHYGRSVSMIAHHPYTHFQSQPQILRAGNTTWSIGGDPIGNRKTFKHGEGHIASGHSPYTPFHHPLTRASHPRFQEMGVQMHEAHVDQGFQKGMFTQREEDVWRPQRNTSPSNFVNPVYSQVDAGFGSTSAIPRGPGRTQNQPFPVSNMYGPSNQSFSQNQQFLPISKPKLHHTGVNQNYPVSNPPLSVPSCDINASCVGMMQTSDAVPSQVTPEDAPILPNDPRYNVYYHLCGLFPEDKVRAVMNSHPEETNAKELCAYIIGAK